MKKSWKTQPFLTLLVPTRFFGNCLGRCYTFYNSNNILKLNPHAYQTSSNSSRYSSPVVIDLRSDTVTKPSEEMRKRMYNADVGDDVFGEDPTVNELQEKAASLLQKEAALFVPSGTMGNLISLMVHCQRRGSEVLLGDRSHLYIFEQGGYAQLGGIHPRVVRNKEDGSMDMNELKCAVRDVTDVHQPRTSLLSIELPFNGRLVPMTFLKQAHEFTRSINIPLHLDGSRIFNAAAALNIPVCHITQYVDSVSVCLSKGLGAPVGSVIAGGRGFIQEATRVRKALGGGMRQAGVVAAAGIVALAHAYNTVGDDHRRAKALAEGISQIKSDKLRVNLREVEMNMILLSLPSPVLTPPTFVRLMTECASEEDVSVLVQQFDSDRIRLVLHRDVSDHQVQQTIDKIKLVISGLDN